MSKKTIIALAALTAMAGSALAAEVTLYGRIDNGLYLTKSKAKDQTSLSMESGIAGASRWGIKGTEDLGNGYKVGFVLESGIKTDTGMGDSKRLFDRDSYLSVGTPFGDFRLGRSGALGGGVSGGIFAGNASPFGVVAASTKIFAVETRVDNMVRYDTPKFAGLKFMAQYSNGMDGDDSVRSSQRDRYAAIGASYEIGGLKLFAVADKVLYNDIKGDGKGKKDTNAYKLAAQYKVVDTVTLYGGYQFVDNAQKIGLVTATAVKGADTHAATLGSRIKLGGGDLNLAVGYVTGDHKDEKKIKHKVNAWQLGVGYTYHISKRTHLYAAAAYIDSKYKKDGVKVTTKKDTDGSTKVKSLMCGMYHTF